ncbi:30S ribosomal protein S8e [Candidatus Woesearchaeota archaeon]|nr:30S ribosomal protein S8e [Candidatus Woesearchaeota archaeon]
MVVIHRRSLRKQTGARKVPYSKKRIHQKGSRPTLTSLGERKVQTTRTRGGKDKQRLLKGEFVNVLDKKTKKSFKVKIKNILENPANRHYIRRNIITKGTIIETEKGKAMVTSRPGQEGSVNAVLV